MLTQERAQELWADRNRRGPTEKGLMHLLSGPERQYVQDLWMRMPSSSWWMSAFCAILA